MGQREAIEWLSREFLDCLKQMVPKGVKTIGISSIISHNDERGLGKFDAQRID